MAKKTKSFKQYDKEYNANSTLKGAVKQSTTSAKYAAETQKTGSAFQKQFWKEQSTVDARRSTKAFDNALYTKYPSLKPKKK